MTDFPQTPEWSPTWVAPSAVPPAPANVAGAGAGGYGGYGGYRGYDTYGGYAGGYGGYPPVGAPPGWEAPPPSAPLQKRHSGPFVILLVAAILAAVIGVFIGRHLGRAATPAAAASSPGSSSSGNPFGNSNPFGNLNPFGGSSSGSGNSSSGGTGSSVSGSAAAIAAKVAPGIVDIDTQLSYQNAAAAGTGDVLTSTGEVLTNNHVINQATSITVTVPSTGKTYSATVVGYDVTQDVAVIQMKGASGLKTVTTGNSDSVKVGDSVVAMGNAGGVGGAPSVVTGTVQGLNQTITASDSNGSEAETLNGMIETDAPIQAGDSGGPLVNANAEVVGMDTAASSTIRRFGSSNSTTSSFAIPINTALSIAKQIEAGQGSATVHIGLNGFLGVVVSGTSSGSGALITQIAPGAPAAHTAMAAGDYITAVDTTPVASGSDLTAALSTKHPGDKVTVTWTTPSGDSQSATVTLGTGPAA